MSKIYSQLGSIFLLVFFTVSCGTISKFQYETDEIISTVFLKDDIRIAEEIFGVKPVVRLPRADEKINATCALGSIPGNLFGNGSEVLFNRFDIKENRINLKLEAARFQNYFEISRPRKTGIEVEFNLSVDPPEAQFSRVATVCVDFVSSLTNDNSQMVSLMYFDRPARLKGNLKTKIHEVIVDLNIPSKGFHYISEKRPKLNTYVYDAVYSGENVRYAVTYPSKK